MASLRAATSSAVAIRPKASCRPMLPSLRRTVHIARAQQQESASPASFGQFLAVSGAVTTLMSSGNALAATELMQMAAKDNRPGILLTLFVPVVGWVLFNIAGPLFNQLDVMGDEAKAVTPDRRSLRLKRSIAGAMGLGAAGLLASAPAEAQELMQLAAKDNRPGILLTLFVPVVGWVLFNIAGPLFNQLDNMTDEAKATSPAKRSIRKKK